MPALAAQDLDTMRQSVFFDGPEAPRKLSRFWFMLVLAPLMTPIQGTMLAVVDDVAAANSEVAARVAAPDRPPRRRRHGCGVT